MDINEVDYKAIAEQLQQELEAAKLLIVRLRYSRSPLDRVDSIAVRRWITDNYLLIVVGVLVASLSMSFIDVLQRLRKGL